MKQVKAFFSCRFNDADADIVKYFKSIARESGIEPILADEPSTEPIADKIDALLDEAGCLVAILTPSAVSDKVCSSWVNQEIGMARARKLPILAFVEEGIDDLGILPGIASYVRFDRANLHRVLDETRQFFTSVRYSATARSVERIETQASVYSRVEEYADYYDSRLFVNFPAKQVIAESVLDMFVNQETSGILLDSGSLTYVIADQLLDSGYRIPVVTNNLALVSKLREIIDYPIIILPGELDMRTYGVGGDVTAQAVIPYLTGDAKPRVELAFLAANAIDPKNGLAADSSMFSSFRAAVLRHAKTVVVVLQGEKFLKGVKEPVVTIDEWNEILARRRKEHSMWVVCHPLAHDYGRDSGRRYSQCMDDFRKVLQPGAVIETRRASP